MKRKPKILKPRNPDLVAAMFRKAGAHGKSRKAERRAAKVSLLKTVDP